MASFLAQVSVRSLLGLSYSLATQMLRMIIWGMSWNASQARYLLKDWFYMLCVNPLYVNTMQNGTALILKDPVLCYKLDLLLCSTFNIWPGVAIGLETNMSNS